MDERFGEFPTNALYLFTTNSCSEIIKQRANINRRSEERKHQNICGKIHPKFVFPYLNSNDNEEMMRTEVKSGSYSSKRIPDALHFFSVAVFFFSFFFFFPPVPFAYLAKIPRTANTIVAGGSYISSVKRKACSKLNFPRRGRLLGVDATAERDPM